jgi:hypothetical protein
MPKRSRSPTTSGGRTCSRARPLGRRHRRTRRQGRPARTGARDAGRDPGLGGPQAARRLGPDYAEPGFDEIYLHHVGKDRREWAEVFGEQVLPAVAG